MASSVIHGSLAPSDIDSLGEMPKRKSTPEVVHQGTMLPNGHYLYLYGVKKGGAGPLTEIEQDLRGWEAKRNEEEHHEQRVT